MSTFTKTFALGLFLLVNACSVGTVTASSRHMGGASMGGGLGGIAEANSPRNVDAHVVDHSNMDRSAHVARENPSFRIESDCRMCR